MSALVQTVRAMARAGQDDTAIGRAVGMSRSGVAGLRTRNGIAAGHVRGGRRRLPDDATLTRLIAVEHRSDSAIAQAYGTSERQAARRRMALGLPPAGIARGQARLQQAAQRRLPARERRLRAIELQFAAALAGQRFVHEHRTRAVGATLRHRTWLAGAASGASPLARAGFIL